MPRVKISSLPNSNKSNKDGYRGNDPEIKINETLKPTSRDNAVLEAEKKETIITNLQGEGIPEFYKIAGKPHSQGGSPLNVPSNSFIFSQDKKLAIKDPEILEMFGKNNKGKKSSYTPAELSQSFNLNKYRKILIDPSSDRVQKETAEKMIQNYNLKLGKLALAQESVKGFKDGIPSISLGYMEHVGLRPEDIINIDTPPTPQEIETMARFGLETFKEGGSAKGNRRVKVTSLPSYSKGGPVKGETLLDYASRTKKNIPVNEENSSSVWDGNKWVKSEDAGIPQTSSKSTKKQNIPQGVNKWDPKKEGYDRSKVRAGDYIKNDQGRYEKVVGFKKKEYTGDFKDERLGDFQQDFGLLEDKFKNKEFKEAFVKAYRDDISKVKPNNIGLTQKVIDKASELSDEQIVENFLLKNKINMAIYNKYKNLNDYDKEDLWDKDPTLANKLANELGFDELSSTQVTAFQSAYAGINELSKKDEFKSLLSDVKLAQVGRADEQLSGMYKGSISQVDGWDGNTTSGQMIIAKDSEFETEEVEDIEDTPVKHFQEAQVDENNPYWTQDLMEIAGRFDDLYGIKKHAPWQAPLEFETATPHFTDFRGTAARIGSQASAGAKQASTFAGPQGYAATFAGIQRGAVDPILKTQEAEYRGNQAIANQFEMFNVQNKLQHARDKQALNTQLYDKSVIANQQFDNAKTMAQHALRMGIANAITNRGKTQTMNAMSNDFAVDPVTGFTYKKNTKGIIEPLNNNNSDAGAYAAMLKNKHPDMTWEDAARFAKIERGIPDTTYPPGVNPAAYMYPGNYE